MSDFSKDQGGIQSSSSTQASPVEGGTPKTGFDESPKAEVKDFGPGPGIGNTRRGIS